MAQNQASYSVTRYQRDWNLLCKWLRGEAATDRHRLSGSDTQLYPSLAVRWWTSLDFLRLHSVK